MVLLACSGFQTQLLGKNKYADVIIHGKNVTQGVHGTLVSGDIRFVRLFAGEWGSLANVK